jgi:citronellol/citronellal dehydrogenase
MSLKDKVIFISGASRGIGLAIVKKAAEDGAKIAIAAKTVDPHPKLEGTIFTAAEEIERAGGQALPLQCDIRSEESVNNCVKKTVEHFGGIDICINNASAISLTPTLQTDMKRYDLMHNINGRGTFLVSKTCIPHLLKSENPHILNLSPPLDMNEIWFQGSVAYTVAKFNMSMFVLGMAAEFKGQIAVNALWPRTAIKTAAVKNILGGDEMMQKSRDPQIMADAAYIILNKDKDLFSGNYVIDDTLLAEHGETNFRKYADYPFAELMPDFFVPADSYPVPKAVKDS